MESKSADVNGIRMRRNRAKESQLSSSMASRLVPVCGATLRRASVEHAHYRVNVACLMKLELMCEPWLVDPLKEAVCHGCVSSMSMKRCST
jgi:hypothetical protein